MVIGDTKMPMLELNDSQVVELVKQLPPRCTAGSGRGGNAKNVMSGCSSLNRNRGAFALNGDWIGRN
jgi:hypothetical protein